MIAPGSTPQLPSSLITDTVLSTGGSAHETVTTDVSTQPSGAAWAARCPVSTGSRIGRYVIGERLGAGGMGEVFAARDTALARDVALKLIKRRSDRSTRRECERLRAEAQALARLSHPNVVHVYEVGEHEGRTFLAMERIHGPTLAELEADSLVELLAIFVQAGRGLAAAHAAGLVHRDFKPNNVLIGGDGRVRVVDFGLAAPVEVGSRSVTVGDESDSNSNSNSSSSNSDSEVRSDSVRGPGTLPYMAPEQAFAGAGGAAADQFGFCVALFEAVYGARPFPARGVMELLCKLDTCTVEYPTEAPPVPRWLRRVLERGLARRPEDRFETMDALLAELTRDRRRIWRRAGFATAIAGLTALVMLVAAPRPAVEATASLADPVLDGTWDAARRLELAQAFERVDTPWSAGSEVAVLAGLDDWSTRWIAAARQRDGIGDPLAQRAVAACLEGQRAHAQSTVDALLGAERELLEGAVAAVDALPEPSRCTLTHNRDALDELGRVDPRLLLPELRGLADAAAQRGLGHFELASTRAGAVLHEARERGWQAVELAALRQRGLAEFEAGRRERGLDDLEQARALAVRTGDRRAEAELWVDLAWAGRKLDNPELRRERLGLAAAHVDALAEAAASPEADRHAQLLAARIRLAAALDLLDQPASSSEDEAPARAEALLLDGLERLEQIGAGDSILAIDYLHALAHVRDAAGDLEQAEHDYRRAIARAERIRGVSHPSSARIWYDAGALALERGDLDLARERLVLSRDLRRQALHQDHPELARSELGLAGLEFTARDYAAAREHAELALLALERSTGNRDALPDTLRMLGLLEAQDHRWQAAVGYYERALAQMPESGLPRALLELDLGKAHAALGRHDRGVELLDAGLPVVAERLGPERCGQLVSTYKRHAASASALGQTAKAAASLEAAINCTTDPDTRAKLELELRRTGDQP